MKSFALKLAFAIMGLFLALFAGFMEAHATQGLDPEPVPTPLYVPLTEQDVESYCRFEISNGFPVSDPDTSELSCENEEGLSVPLHLDDVCQLWWGHAWPIAFDARQGVVCASRAYVARYTRNR